MVWNVTTGSYIDASPAINGNDVIVASDDGVVYVIDVVSGEVVSRYSDMAGSESSAAIGWDGAGNVSLFLSFPYVCPEPVLAK